jgi:hypothetical protein
MASGGPLEVSNVYAKPASDANPIFMFDIVQKTATSSARPEGGQPAPGCRGGNLGTAGTGLWLGASLNHGAASTLTKHVVADDPKTVFLAQSDKATAATIAAVVGKNANMVVSGGSNAQLGPKGNLQSGMVLNDATVATTTGLDVRILRWLNSPENPDSAAFPLLEVMIVLHQYEQQATTAV